MIGNGPPAANADGCYPESVAKVLRLQYERYKPVATRPHGKGAFCDFVTAQMQEADPQPASQPTSRPAAAAGTPIPIARRTIKLL